MLPLIFKGRFYPVITFFNGIIGQADDEKFGAGRNINFNGNGGSFDTVNSAAKGFN